MAGSDRSRTQWRELFHEVVETNLCTGCAACVMACPRDVLDYDHAETYHPFNVELSTAADDCVHGQRGCDICTRACPRFRDWEVECDQALFGRAGSPTRSPGCGAGCSWPGPPTRRCWSPARTAGWSRPCWSGGWRWAGSRAP